MPTRLHIEIASDNGMGVIYAVVVMVKWEHEFFSLHFNFLLELKIILPNNLQVLIITFNNDPTALFNCIESQRQQLSDSSDVTRNKSDESFFSADSLRECA